MKAIQLTTLITIWTLGVLLLNHVIVNNITW